MAIDNPGKIFLLSHVLEKENHFTISFNQVIDTSTKILFTIFLIQHHNIKCKHTKLYKY